MTSTLTQSCDHLLPGTEVKAGLLSWQSCGLSRVSHASFDFEAISAVSSLDLLANVREITGEVLYGLCPSLHEENGNRRRQWKANLPATELHSDSMGLVKAVRLGVSGSLSSSLVTVVFIVVFVVIVVGIVVIVVVVVVENNLILLGLL